MAVQTQGQAKNWVVEAWSFLDEYLRASDVLP
jgi:hypothetical protein